MEPGRSRRVPPFPPSLPFPFFRLSVRSWWAAAVARDVGLGARAPATVAAVGRSGEGAAAARTALCRREETAAWRLSFFLACESAPAIARLGTSRLCCRRATRKGWTTGTVSRVGVGTSAVRLGRSPPPARPESLVVTSKKPWMPCRRLELPTRGVRVGGAAIGASPVLLQPRLPRSRRGS